MSPILLPISILVSYRKSSYRKSMPCKIYLRHDQSSSQRGKSQSGDVCVYAPSWVKEGINIISEKLNGIQFNVLESPGLKRSSNSSNPKNDKVLEQFKITNDWNIDSDLVLLQKIARNEPKNITGWVNISNYKPDISDDTLIYSIKDLARQSIIVGKDMTSHYGGFKCPRVPQREAVYICDLAALQFEHTWNSGRLVLIQEIENFKGPLDDFIFEKVVGEKRKSFKEVSKLVSEDDNAKQRYIVKHNGFMKGGKGGCFMDAVAYKKFVKLDVVLTGLALSDLASKKGDKLNLKFLKYGTGFYAGKFGPQLNSHILTGVVDGIEELFEKHRPSCIKFLSFPFYECDHENKKRLEMLKQRYQIEYEFLNADALKQTQIGKGLVTATTNCASSHVSCGNAMKLKSTDGAISVNLVSKGNILCPNMNNVMKHKYIEV